jgi:hypothetical protein
MADRVPPKLLGVPGGEFYQDGLVGQKRGVDAFLTGMPSRPGGTVRLEPDGFLLHQQR